MRRHFPCLLALALGATEPATAQMQMIREYVGAAAGDEFGFSVDGAGDVNGDSVPDVIVGADRDDNNGSNSGTVTVYSGLDGSVLYTWDGPEANARLGERVAGPGDINQDGYDDVMMVASYQTVIHHSGVVTVRSGFDGSILHQWEPGTGGELYGAAIAGVGDVNSDTYPDLAVTALVESVGASQGGGVYLYSGFDGSLIRSHHGTFVNGLMGYDVDGGEDVNGDGVPDYAVCTALQNLVEVFSGADGSLIHSLTNSGAFQFGRNLDLCGDLNNDGKSEILANDGSGNGRVWIYSGAEGTVLDDLLGDAQQDQFGWGMTSLADADADGIPDIAVGAYADDDRGSACGSVRVFSGADRSELFTLYGATSGTAMGWDVKSAGDVDGDGRTDLVVASMLAYHSASYPGNVRVYSGTCRGLSLEYGTGTAGSGGFVPHLKPFGCTGRSARYGLDMDGGLGGTTGFLAIGVSSLNAPFLGGTLLVSPPWVLSPVFASGNGAGNGVFSTTSFVPEDPAWNGFTVYFQVLLRDAAAPGGFAMSNGVSLTYQ